MAISITGSPSGGDGQSRFLSTVVQLGLAGAFTEIVGLIGEDIGGRGQAYVMALSALAITWAMAWADAHGISYPGKQALGRGGLSE
jgi:hypothetical protein